MPRQPPNTGSSATASQRPVRKKSTTPGFREKIRAEIQKALRRDLNSLWKLRNQEKKNPQWANWSEDERNNCLQSVTRQWVEDRKRSGQHISCRFEIFTDYVPKFLGARVTDPEKQELIHEQIRVRGQEPIEEGDEGQGYGDDDEDDEELVPTHLMAKRERSGERELNENEPYIATPVAEDERDDEAEVDGEEAESGTETEGESEDEDEDEVEVEDEAESESDDEESDTAETATPNRACHNTTQNTNSPSTVSTSHNQSEKQPLTAIIRGYPHPLPAPPSQLTKPLDALKQHYRIPTSLASKEKAVLCGRLDVLHGDGVDWEWQSRGKKRGVENGEGDGKERREGWRKRVKTEKAVKGEGVVKVERES